MTDCDCLADLADLNRREHMDRVTVNGEDCRVLVSRVHDETHVVPEPVAVYDQDLSHPAAAGAAGFVGLLAVLSVPVAGGYWLACHTGVATAPRGGYWLGLAAAALAVFAFNRLLRGVLGDWLRRFLIWDTHKHLIERDTEVGG